MTEFYGDDDHFDSPIPEEILKIQKENDLLRRLNDIVLNAEELGIDAGTVRTVRDAVSEINNLRLRIFEIKLGFEGCCHACEPVAIQNDKLRSLLSHIPEDVMMRNVQLAMTNEQLLRERDQARITICEIKSLNYGGKISPIDYAELNKWDCYKEIE
jgi:hypothetical protein